MDKEGQNLEYKEKLNDAVFKTISAFSNTDGGNIFIGIDDKFQIRGVNFSNKDIEAIVNKTIDSLGIHPEIKLIEIESKAVLKITIQKSSVPISFEGRYYKRIGNTTREMKAEELKSFFVKDTNWDSLTNDSTIEEIDIDTVNRFLKMALKSGRIRIKDEDVFESLKRLKLIINNKVTNAAIMLFGKDPQKYFINAVVRVGRFKDESTIIGDQWIDGNLFKQIDESIEQIKKYINVRYEINDKIERYEIWDYPLDAIREALLNAIIHRDYFKSNIQTQIKIFDDYIWFYNTGGLAEGIYIDQLKTVHPSISRNPMIMHIFYLAGFVEEYGSGISRILKAFKDNNLPEPEFSEEFVGFSVYFRKDLFTKEYLLNKGLNERQIKAVLYLKEKSSISNQEYQELNKISKRTATNDLTDLLNKGILEKTGTTGKGNKYILKGQMG